MSYYVYKQFRAGVDLDLTISLDTQPSITICNIHDENLEYVEYPTKEEAEDAFKMLYKALKGADYEEFEK